MKGYYQKAPSVKKTFPKPEPTEQYEQPLGPPRPTATQRFESEHQFISGAVHRVKDAAYSGAAWMQKRGQEINEESRRQPRARAPPMMHMPTNPFAMGPMTGPFMDQSPPIKPQRRRKRRRRNYEEEPQSHRMFSDPFHIPDSMRHMF